MEETYRILTEMDELMEHKPYGMFIRTKCDFSNILVYARSFKNLL